MTSWQFARLYYDSKIIGQTNVYDVPISVCGMLGRLLPDTSNMSEAPGISDTPSMLDRRRVRRMRADIGHRLRLELQPEWLQTTDLAIVALALDGLHACAPAAVTGSDIAIFATRLVASEAAIGGPYRQPNGNIDPLTNAAISQCIDWVALPLPNVKAYLMTTVEDADMVDAPGVTILAAIQQSVDKLIGPDTPAGQLRACVNVLNGVVCLRIMHQAETNIAGDMITASALERRIQAYCLGSLPEFSEPFSTNTSTMLQQVFNVDTNHEISQLAWYYGSALVEPIKRIDPTKSINPTTATYPAKPNLDTAYMHLGVANIYAWAAYTIYDDFLDNEGQPVMLGTANYVFRAMLRQYQVALPSSGNADKQAFQAFVEHVLTVVDQANTLETTYYRMPVTEHNITIMPLPEYGACDLLADRALFHILGPMAVLSMSGRSAVGDTIWNDTLQAFRHYLIARQLNDDIHDWLKDLQAGQASYVVVELLRHLNISPGVYAFSQLLPHAQQQFWQYVMPGICRTAQDHMSAARRLLGKGLPLTPDNQLFALFEYVEDSMEAAYSKRQQSYQLLQAFRLEASTSMNIDTNTNTVLNKQ